MREFDNDPMKVYYRLLRNGLLEKTLQKARDGVLAPNWRETLHKDPSISHTYNHDVHTLVLADILESPPAPWEPGHAPDWATALTSWYVTARSVLAESRHLHMVNQANTLKVSGQNVGAHICTSTSAAGMVASLAAGDDLSDKTIQQTHETYIACRDRLTASYLAGLAAGGSRDPFDWKAWLEARMETWTNEMLIKSTRLYLQASLLQRLPSYWASPRSAAG